MGLTCEYCGGLIDGARTCVSCGAPVTRQVDSSDFRTCPFCHRKLLALGSPACNHCGRRLPDEYIKTREADLRRVVEVKDGREVTETDRKIDQLIRQTARGQLMRSSSPSGLIDIPSLID